MIKLFFLWIRHYFEQAKVHAGHIKRGNRIHPTAYIHPDAVIGRGNYFGPYCYIGEKVTIGSSNHFESHVAVGTQPEHAAFWLRGTSTIPGKAQKVFIGHDNVFREFVTVQGGTKRITTIQSGCRFLRGSHVSHDTYIESHVNVSCNVLIGGETVVLKGANLGLGAIVHQQHIIGAYSMLGMGTVVPKKTDIEPGFTYVGNPAKALKPNDRGYQAAGGYDKIQDHIRHYRALKEAQ